MLCYVILGFQGEPRVHLQGPYFKIRAFLNNFPHDFFDVFFSIRIHLFNESDHGSGSA